MQKIPATFLLVFAMTAAAFAMGHTRDRSDIQPVQRGSPANPNPAYNPPSWNYTPPVEKDPTASKHAKTKSPAKAVPDSPAPAADAFPEFTTPQPAATAPAAAHDSVEPPLPDEPGGNLDKKPSFK